LASITIGGRINTGTGAFAGITNPAPSGATTTMTLTRISTSPLAYNLTLTGSATLNGSPVNLAINAVPVTQGIAAPNVFGTSTGSGTLTTYGNFQLSGSFFPAGGKTFSTAIFGQFVATLTFTSGDTLKFLLEIHDDVLPPNSPFTFIGGTGMFNGASGTGTLTFTGDQGDAELFNIAGDVILADATTPVITSVRTAYYTGDRITQNDWIQIQGDHLTPASTPNGGVYWSDAPEFLQNRMPTQVGGISVTVNGKPAYVWWFCSAATTSLCAKDQINVLTPLDSAVDQRVLVVVKNGSKTSAAFLVPKEAGNPAPLLFDIKGYAVATHANYSLLGPVSLYPGASTPAFRGETIIIWTVGYGLPVNPLVEGSAFQSGALPFLPSCTLEGKPVVVVLNLVSPGLYQMNLTIPLDAPSGDNHLYCVYNGAFTPGSLIAVQ
jgi:uncharacterized protein (TIGR03437 family)